MQQTDRKWLPLDVAAERYGYAFKESFTRRLRQLRRERLVIDTGCPPANYRGLQHDESAEIVLMWPNPKTALLRADAPRGLLGARRGRPPKSRR